ncbi:starch synthase (maltosyl-transferring) [Kytococcus aerolatus]|uniref:Alpha-1,4-glucan:maltose-1-phosphate maltosyltransferase n=1 Tax=Kytococcus aerolatus TaxID=592308 RepID=A0A212U0J9_9MICO|nr:alpha-1,4-glucan--maltose-1-phosphate maltosyltransferase [Kytococcus aerolatus]SNC71768.1 starch synthase (maltosyl-transferring) [Kytococcus aerolatus]
MSTIARPFAHDGQTPLGRIPVLDVHPVVDGGARPAKAVVGEEFPVTATVFREGHDAVNATALLVAPDGSEHRTALECTNRGLDAWAAEVAAGEPGTWSLCVEGWSDPYATWAHHATVKVEAGIDVELMLAEGGIVLTRALEAVADGAPFVAAPGHPTTEPTAPSAAAPGSPAPTRPEALETVRAALTALQDTGTPAGERLAAATSPAVRTALARYPLRELVTSSPRTPLWVERELALAGAWYEFFPRSEGARQDPETGEWTSGTFATAAERLPAIADMGFDVVYLTPIHPIGSTHRKGPNNTLEAGPEDPGSPYAIGSAEGGHDALHPDLGDWADFDAFVARATELGLEVALDLALQCSPDHPWVSEHPEWFVTRADGSIAYAENPPKKYQDIYPLHFDTDPTGLAAEIRRVIGVWLDHGIRIFRVDNPHTKPVELWQWLIGDVRRTHPETIWLAEAFTRPAMMHTLAKVGFQQSYTYYAWRHDKEELTEYCRELAGPAAAYMRPSFWPTTHDILTPFMQHGGETAHRLRSALAATLVPTYGIYAGYEHCESVARPGAEEHLDNEKYQYVDRRWEIDGTPEAGDRPDLSGWLRMVNDFRRAHPALARLRNLHFHETDHRDVIAYSKRRTLTDERGVRTEDVVLVVANLNPHTTVEATVHLDLPALGLEPDSTFTVHDAVTGETWEWGAHQYVRVGIDSTPIHLAQVLR